MNQKGVEYIIRIKTLLADNNIKPPIFDESKIYERCMRLGIENNLYELKTSEERAMVAISTLKEDYLYSQLHRGTKKPT